MARKLRGSEFDRSVEENLVVKVGRSEDPSVAGLTLDKLLLPDHWKFRSRESLSDFAKKANILQGNLGIKPFDISNTPYLAEVFEALEDGDTSTVVLRWASQLAKTTALQIFQLWWAKTYRTPTMWVHPEDALRKDQTDRVAAMVDTSPELARHADTRHWRKEQLQYDGVPLFQALARSSADLSSRSVAAVLLDEVSKYPDATGSEGTSPIDQAIARTRTFRHRKKIVMTSTPEGHDSLINQHFRKGSQEHWCVRGQSGRWFPWDWRYVKFGRSDDLPWADFAELLQTRQLPTPMVAFPDGTTIGGTAEDESFAQSDLRAERARNTMNSEGRFCKQDADGEWVPDTCRGYHSRSFCVGALSGRSTSLRELVVLWARAEAELARTGDDSLRRAFILHQLGEPYTPKGAALTKEQILDCEVPLVRGQFFPDTDGRRARVVGVDVQHDGIWWVRVSANLISKDIVVEDSGFAGGFSGGANTNDLFGLLLPLCRGASLLVDSGDVPQPKMEACRMLRAKGLQALPIKGRAMDGAGVYHRMSKTQAGEPLLLLNSELLRNILAHGVASKTIGFFRDASQDPDLIEQFGSARRRNGKWVQNAGGHDHLLDALAYAIGGLILAGLYSNRRQGTATQAQAANRDARQLTAAPNRGTHSRVQPRT